MIGTYSFKQDGKVLAKSKNVLTQYGRETFLRFLAGEINEWAGAVVLGSGEAPAALADTRMQYEFLRAAVNLKVSRVSTNSVIIRGILPADTAGRIYEAGLVSSLVNPNTQGIGAVLASFNPQIEDVVGGTEDATNYRVSDRSISVAPGAGASVTVSYPAYVNDFSTYQNYDTFSLAYFNRNANADSIRVRAYVDSTNYFTFTVVPGITTGYRIAEWTRSQFVATGTPSWEDISSLEFLVTAGTGGAASVSLDALRINDVDSYVDYGLVSRSVLTAAVEKFEGQELEVEYEVQFTF